MFTLRASASLVALLMMAGCDLPAARSPPPDAAPSTPRTSSTATPVAPADQFAMRPMLGMWTLDVDATLAENHALPEERLSFIAGDLSRHPFSLEITRDRYVSRSLGKTIADRYRYIGTDDAGANVIALESVSDDPRFAPDRLRPATERADAQGANQRTSRLCIRGGQLLIGSTEAGDLCVVMRRLPT